MTIKVLSASMAALSAAVLLVGCAAKSPAIGTWNGSAAVTSTNPMAQAMAAQVSAATQTNMSLKEDGTGFIKVGAAPEQPVKWEEKEKKVTLSSTGKENKTFVGTLGEDGKTMTIDVGPAKLNLTKAEK